MQQSYQNDLFVILNKIHPFYHEKTNKQTKSQLFLLDPQFALHPLTIYPGAAPVFAHPFTRPKITQLHVTYTEKQTPFYVQSFQSHLLTGSGDGSALAQGRLVTSRSIPEEAASLFATLMGCWYADCAGGLLEDGTEGGEVSAGCSCCWSHPCIAFT